MKTATGYWGEVIVKAEDKKEAEKIVKDFLESTEDK
jgi:glutathione synthase/RimK-type ligase-like ATP-grasp enzyme